MFYCLAQFQERKREERMKIQFSVIFYCEETVIGDFIGLEAVQILQYKLILYSALTSGSVSRRRRKERKKQKTIF